MLKSSLCESTKMVTTLTKKTEQQALMLHEANAERIHLHNSLQVLNGNIRVYCRVRPPVTVELKKKLYGIVHTSQTRFAITVPQAQTTSKASSKNHTKKMGFSFDLVFKPKDDQAMVFDYVEHLVQSAIDGFNVFVIAYGQTGSGKTYTMDGVSSDEGIIPRTVDSIFSKIDGLVDFGWNYTVHFSCLEIYNDCIQDLLISTKDLRQRDNLELTEIEGDDIIVQNLDVRETANAAELKEYG